MTNEQTATHKPTKEEADKKLEQIKPESAGGMSTDAAQFDPNTGQGSGSTSTKSTSTSDKDK